MLRLDINKIKPLLDFHGFRLDYSYEESSYDAFSKPFMVIKLFKGNKEVGKCRFIENSLKENHFYLKRIDIHDEADQSKGYGSLLLYASLCAMQDQGVTECELTAFSDNYSFYVRNGFYFLQEDVDINWWYSLSVTEKKDLLYLSELNGEKIDANVSKEDYFMNDSGDYDLDGVKFYFTHEHAIRLADANIDALHNKVLVEQIVNQFQSPQEREECKEFFNTRERFFSGLANGFTLFRQDLEGFVTETPKPSSTFYPSAN